MLRALQIDMSVIEGELGPDFGEFAMLQSLNMNVLAKCERFDDALFASLDDFLELVRARPEVLVSIARVVWRENQLYTKHQQRIKHRKERLIEEAMVAASGVPSAATQAAVAAAAAAARNSAAQQGGGGGGRGGGDGGDDDVGEAQHMASKVVGDGEFADEDGDEDDDGDDDDDDDGDGGDGGDGDGDGGEDGRIDDYDRRLRETLAVAKAEDSKYEHKLLDYHSLFLGRLKFAVHSRFEKVRNNRISLTCCVD